MLTATFPYYRLLDSRRGPAGGIEYQDSEHTKNRKIDQFGIRIQHTLSSIAGVGAPGEIVFRDRPEIDYKVTRVTGPFCVEATIPASLEGGSEDDVGLDGDTSFVDRMLEVLRRNPVVQLGGNRSLNLENVGVPAKSLSISAEAVLESDGGSVALVFGPENGAVSEKLVFEAARESHARSYDQLIVIGFAIEAGAREFVEKCGDLVGIPATYVQATPDLVMGDLLKTMRSSQIFSVSGLPDVAIKTLPSEEPGGALRYQIELRGLDVFDPTTMQVDHRSGMDVPAWFLDTDYNELCFLVSQAFFPRTSAWESLKTSLKGDFEDSVWEHLAGTTSAPFVSGENRRVAVKVIDDRGNELLVVKRLDETG
jgi:adenine-specific DNA-methyltransferase